jgi:hypothetical protein
VKPFYLSSETVLPIQRNYDRYVTCTGTDVGYPGGGLFNPMGMAKPGTVGTPYKLNPV